MDKETVTNFMDVLNTLAKNVWVFIPIAVLITGVKCLKIVMDSSVRKSAHQAGISESDM